MTTLTPREATKLLERHRWTVTPARKGQHRCQTSSGEWLEMDTDGLIAAAAIVAKRPDITADDLVAAIEAPSAEAPPMTVADLDVLKHLPPVPDDLPGWAWEFDPTRGLRLSSPLDGYATKWNAPDLDAAVVVEARQLAARDAAAAAQARPDPRPLVSDVVLAMERNTPIDIDLALIDDNPYQTRLSYDDEKTREIAASINTHGLLQVPLGRYTAGGRVQLAFGHTRLRAYRLLAAENAARFGRMPLMLRQLDEETMFLHAWSENRDRKDLTAYEEARAIQSSIETFKWTQKQAAERLGLTQPTIANKLRLLRLPAAVLTQLEAGHLSERQAAALLPLMDLPEHARRLPVQYWTGTKYIPDANALFASAAGYDSAQLRDLVDRFLEKLTVPLAKQPWKGEAWAIESVVAPRCADCPIRLKSADRCPDKVCAERKAVAWRSKQASAAAAAAGLPAKAVGDYGTYDDLSGVNLKAIRAKAEEKGCGNLGVVHHPNGYLAHKVSGCDGCGIVCAHGQGKRCGCKQSLNRSSDPAASNKAKEKHERERIKQELVGPAVAAARQALADPTAHVWRKLLGAINGSAAAKLPKDADVAQIQAALATVLIDEAIAYNLAWTPNYASAQSTLAKLLTSLGVAAPWDAAQHSRANTPDPAGAGDSPLAPIVAGIAELEAWVTEEGDAEDEEIRVALVDAAAIRKDLEALADAPDVGDQVYEGLVQRLGALDRALREQLTESEVGA